MLPNEESGEQKFEDLHVSPTHKKFYILLWRHCLGLCNRLFFCYSTKAKAWINWSSCFPVIMQVHGSHGAKWTVKAILCDFTWQANYIKSNLSPFLVLLVLFLLWYIERWQTSSACINAKEMTYWRLLDSRNLPAETWELGGKEQQLATRTEWINIVLNVTRTPQTL